MSNFGPNVSPNMVAPMFVHGANVNPAAVLSSNAFPCSPCGPAVGGAGNSVGVILVLFILLVIILRSVHHHC